MKNFILSTALVLGALSVSASASNSLDADFNASTELIAEEGCTTTTVTKKVTNKDGSSEEISVSVEVCD